MDPPVEETSARVDGLRGVIPAVDFDGSRASPLTNKATSPCSFPCTSFEALAAGRPLIDRFSPRYLRDVGMYVYENAAGEVLAAISDQQQLHLIDTVAWTLQRQVTPELAPAEDILAAIGRVCGLETAPLPTDPSLASLMRSEAEDDSVETLRDLASGAPVVRAVNEIIELALERRATDIHLEPVRNGIRVRIRIDGILTTVRTFTTELARPIVSRVKILASLNIAERRLPQDGRCRIRVGNVDADIRVATMPTAFGEAAILRLLQREKGIKPFGELGLSSRDLSAFSRALKTPHGMIVVTGPTGSGKTTTLAGALGTLNDATRKILTIEDPIEYEIDGVNQSQVKPAIGLTFANALRAFLRQDPDVIMVGEMRDIETARVGIQASLTGHLVLTTLHTNTAAAAITRLLDLQIEPFLLSASLHCIVAQRLVRLLCRHCRRAVKVDAQFLHRDARYRALVAEGATVWEPGRCERCVGTGYSGRRAVFEVLDVDDELRHRITGGASENEIESFAKANGMTTLIEDGVRAALAGETSLDEVLRVTASR
jgi:general secretion pathway protein E